MAPSSERRDQSLSPARPASPRFVAIETLRRLEKSRKPVGTIFNRAVAETPLGNKDRQLANTIIHGVLRKRQSLDYVLQQLCRQPLRKIKPFIHQSLRVGLFQILYLDRIPESAAVNESVKAVQNARLPKKLQGFVNAVLRNAIRRREELLSSINGNEDTIVNHPDWLCRRWEERYSKEESRRICSHNDLIPPLTLQVNSCKAEPETVKALFCQDAITFRSGSLSNTTILLEDFHGDVTRLPGFSEGLFLIQDQGAALLPQLLGPMGEGEKYLDACAGLGGKTSSMIQLAAPGRAEISAVEPDRSRREKFKENMARLHPDLDVPLFKGGLEEFATSTTSTFHGILLDAPCSGTGVIRRHPDIRWNRRAEEFVRYQKTQLQLLQSATALLRDGGVLVYATCSLEGEENEEVIEQFLGANRDFSLQDCTEYLPTTARSLVRDGFFAPLPGPETDGFFGARLVKRCS
ncbi:MAG: 16S rRNA (cytosine(967)-C(5))-methyltransferase RsmB [Thermodesulfobacteriota bacterium]